jgi:hypothetical protein
VEYGQGGLCLQFSATWEAEVGGVLWSKFGLGKNVRPYLENTSKAKGLGVGGVCSSSDTVLA